MTFAAPGLSSKGTASASAVSKSKTASAAITCTGGKKGKGTLDANKIKSTSTTTCATDTSPPSPCPTGDYVYDSAGQLATASGNLYQEVKTTTFVIKGTTYVAKNTSSAAASTCTSTELGFVLNGTLTAPASLAGEATTITACLDTDTGTNTTGNFRADLTSELGSSGGSIVIKSAGFDPATSSIVFQ